MAPPKFAIEFLAREAIALVVLFFLFFFVFQRCPVIPNFVYFLHFELLFFKVYYIWWFWLVSRHFSSFFCRFFCFFFSGVLLSQNLPYICTRVHKCRSVRPTFTILSLNWFTFFQLCRLFWWILTVVFSLMVIVFIFGTTVLNLFLFQIIFLQFFFLKKLLVIILHLVSVFAFSILCKFCL